MALALLEFHLVRRYLETTRLMRYPPGARMHGIAYLFGLRCCAGVLPRGAAIRKGGYGQMKPDIGGAMLCESTLLCAAACAHCSYYTLVPLTILPEETYASMYAALKQPASWRLPAAPPLALLRHLTLLQWGVGRCMPMQRRLCCLWVPMPVMETAQPSPAPSPAPLLWHVAADTPPSSSGVSWQLRHVVVDLQGVAVFLGGNLLQWHTHKLLAGLAAKAGAAGGTPAYKIPHGGWVRRQVGWQWLSANVALSGPCWSAAPQGWLPWLACMEGGLPTCTVAQ